MGSVFTTNFQYFETIAEYLKHFPRHKKYAFMTDGQSGLETISHAHKPFALIFGNEATGLPADMKRIGETVRIKQSELVDSLNLGVSVSIALHWFYTNHS